MAEVNVNSAPIQPEVPKVLDNEQINVYVPIATDKYPGVAKFDTEHFDVNPEGNVTLSTDVVHDLLYVRKTLDNSDNNDGLVESEDGYKNTLLQTTNKQVIPAINELNKELQEQANKIGEGEITSVDMAEGESGLIGLANANRAKLVSHMADTGKKFETLDADNEKRDGRIDVLSEDVSDIETGIGSEELQTDSKTITGAVNENYRLAQLNKRQTELNRLNLSNVSAQLQGVARSYVVPDFTFFIGFLKSDEFIELKEDRNGDGVNETYKIYISDLKTGDNIIITENSVPDFWFEKNSAMSSFEVYEYNDVEYVLSAKIDGLVIGGAHILETDYNIIEQHASSAQMAAQEVKEALTKVRGSFPYRAAKVSEIDDLHGEDRIGVYHVHDTIEHDEGEGNPPTYVTTCFPLLVLRGADYQPYAELEDTADGYLQIKIISSLMYRRSWNEYDTRWTEWTQIGKYVLPIASKESLGGFRVGDGLSIDANGVLSADGLSEEDINRIIPVDFWHETVEGTSDTFESAAYYAELSSTDVLNPINMDVNDVVRVNLTYLGSKYVLNGIVTAKGNSITIDFGYVTLVDETANIKLDLYANSLVEDSSLYQVDYDLYGFTDSYNVDYWSYSLVSGLEINEKYLPKVKSAYQYAQDGGYAGTEAEFAEDINPDNILAKATPKKGVDYFDGNDGKDYVLTSADKTEIVETVKNQVPLVKSAEQPTFVNSIDEMTDTGKVYVMPDGYMYAHVTEKNYNLFILNDVQVPNRLQDDSTEIISSTSNAVTGFIPVQYGKYYSFSAEFGGVRKVLNTGSENPNIVRMNVKKTDGTVVALGKSIPYCSPNNAITIPSNDIVAIQFQFRFVTNNGGTVLSIANIKDVRAYKPMFVEGDTQAEAVENATNLPYIEGSNEPVSTWKNTGLAYNQPTDYEERVIELENRVEELETSVEKLKNNSAENVLLNGKTILNFGDSIAEGGANNYRNYCTIISEKYNMSVNSVAVSGAIMARNTALTGSHSVLTQIDNAITNHGSKTFDFIVLEGGTNDLNYIAQDKLEIGTITDAYDGEYDETTAIGALEKAIYLIRTTWLSSNIIFVIPHHMSSRDYAITKELWSKYVDVCKKWGVPVVNVYEEGQYNTFIASMNALYARTSEISDTGYDRTHPNEDGYKKWYCPLIVSKMKEIVFE